jgi:multiple sugar transport system substrate-binding protein
MVRSLAVRLAALLLIAGCSASGTPVHPTSSALAGTGPITFVTGLDLTGFMQPLVDQWDAAHPAEKVTLLQLPEASDDQRAQMVANLQAKSDRYDVLNLDIVWTAEFAAAHWIIPLDSGQFPLTKFLPPVVDTARYRGKLYAVPFTSNAGLLYYRSDILAKEHQPPPQTWAELSDDARTIAPKYKVGGYAGQLSAYEGLTVNLDEAVGSAGGSILAHDGTKVSVDSPQAREGLNFLVGGVKEGWIPKQALTYDEESSRMAFQNGNLLFLRNWPYVYGLANEAKSKVKGKFAVEALPGPNGPGSSELGGANLAISAYSKHQRTALEFIKYLTGLNAERQVLVRGSFPPVWTQLYDDPALIKRFPYLPILKKSILSAKARLVSPNYSQVSLTISSAAYAALSGSESTDTAISQMTKDLQSVIASH